MTAESHRPLFRRASTSATSGPRDAVLGRPGRGDRLAPRLPTTRPEVDCSDEVGLSDPVRMAVMGHASREMTDRYTHAMPTSEEAAEAIDAAFGGSVDAAVDAIDVR
jgi:hypothetical protein